jgi:RNA polymerase sigma-70 factor (ECF subfamily)
MLTTTPTPTGHLDQSSTRDDEALRQMYTDNAAALRTYVRRFTTDAHADDIVQETFIRAWRHLDRLQSDERPVRPWLIRVARHLLTDAARHDRRRPATVPDDTTAATVGVDGGLDRVLDQQVLVQALGQLPAAQLEVLVESWLYGASLDAVAEQLGIPSGTARSRKYYALRALRGQLASIERVAS